MKSKHGPKPKLSHQRLFLLTPMLTWMVPLKAL